MNIDRRTTTFSFLAEPSDVNFGGKVHGSIKWPMLVPPPGVRHTASRFM